MPTYQYECSKCGTVTEVFQSITESPRRKLRKSDDPQCSCSATVIRLIGTGAGVIFKGSGFYETDYRSESYKKAAKEEKDATKPKKDGDDKSSDKPKTESKDKTDKKATATKKNAKPSD